MCGIAGIVNKQGILPEKGQLQRMQQAIQHRGPDAEGVVLFPGCGLAHRRLSIIDLSPGGAQPKQDQTGRYSIVFNGEIYNFLELKKQLEERGVRFQSHSDTEVLIEGFRIWGIDVLEKLRGMFAFAIWDTQEQVLTLARDRIGKKPLFFTELSNGVLAFASEIKAFASVKKLEPDWQAVRTFLGLQYVPSPQTGFEGVRQILPGNALQWKNGEMKIWTYALPSNDSQKSAALSTESIDENIRSLLSEAVKIRQLASDVPVGAFLSGGVDSAAVVAFASQQAGSKLKTFTMGFDEADMDERAEAAALAAHFQTEHHAFLAKPEDLLHIADELIQQYDAPYADSSALPLWLLAEQTAKQVKVVLTGDGGDELFGGYRRYLHFIRGQQIARLPLLGAWTGKNMRRIGTWFQDTDIVRMGRLIETLRQDPVRAYGELFTGAYFDSHDLPRMFRADFLAQTKQADAVDFVSSFQRRLESPDAPSSLRGTKQSLLESALHFDLRSYLPDDLNVKMDRATMRWGLEARSPFLDQHVVAYATGLPLSQKVAHGKTKIALKQALRGIVPDEVLTRQKRGFQVPLAAWFRGPLKQAFTERCLDPQGPLTNIANLDAVKKLLEANEQGANHGNRLWMLYSLATWLQQHNI